MTRPFEKIVNKVWGYESWIVNAKGYCGKILRVYPGHQCSLHSHPVKAETFYVLSGVGLIELDGEAFVLDRGKIVDILPGQFHRFINTGKTFDLILMEFSTHHEDDDVVRKEVSR